MKVITDVRAVLLKRMSNNSTEWSPVSYIKGGSTLVNAADIRKYAYRHWADRPDLATVKCGRRFETIVPRRSSAFVLVNRGIVMHAYSWYES